MNASLPGPLRITREANFYIHVEIIADDRVTGGFGRLNVMGAFGRGWIGVVDDEALAIGDAGFDQRALPGTRFHRIEIHPDMRRREPLLEEAAFSSALQPNENHRFHWRSKVVCAPTSGDRRADCSYTSLFFPAIAIGGMGRSMSQVKFSGTRTSLELRACSQLTSWPV